MSTHVAFPAGSGAKQLLGKMHWLVALHGGKEQDTWSGPVPEGAATTVGDGYDVRWDAGIGPQKSVALRAWVDTNDNGVEDAGDFVGVMMPSPFEAHDSGGCSERKVNVTPTVTLRPWAPPTK